MSRNGRLWITWERQRRSLELAAAFDCELAVIEFDGRIRRYVRSLAKTFAIVLRKRPTVLFVQNPSMVLAAFACVLGPILRIPVVVDRHTTFLLGKDVHANWRRRIYWLLHRFTTRRAALTIVTNSHLAGLVREAGGRSAILPDRIPTLRRCSNYATTGDFTVIFPASYGADEPLDAVLDACRSLPANVHVYVTGNYRRHAPDLPGRSPRNVTFTGFLSEQDYVNLLFSVDAVLALTTAESCMLCACYEAVAAGKPLITSDQAVLREYFDRALFVQNTSESIARGVLEFTENRDRCAAESRVMQSEMSEKWTVLHRRVSAAIDTLG